MRDAWLYIESRQYGLRGKAFLGEGLFAAQNPPYGATFTGRAWSEPILLRLAFAFEQATQARRPPPGLPPLDTACAP